MSFLSRSLLEDAHFSPLVDLERNNKIGLLRFTDHYSSGQRISAKRIEILEKNIINYFRSRDEDNIKKPLPTTNTTVMTSRPITASSDEVFRSNDGQTSSLNDTINSSFWNYPSRYQSNRNETVY